MVYKYVPGEGYQYVAEAPKAKVKKKLVPKKAVVLGSPVRVPIRKKVSVPVATPKRMKFWAVRLNRNWVEIREGNESPKVSQSTIKIKVKDRVDDGYDYNTGRTRWLDRETETPFTVYYFDGGEPVQAVKWNSFYRASIVVQNGVKGPSEGQVFEIPEVVGKYFESNPV